VTGPDKPRWPDNLWRNRKLTAASLADLRNVIIAALLCVSLLGVVIYFVILLIVAVTSSGPNTSCPPGQYYSYTLKACTR
jgi:hypothetical protein